MRRMETLSRRKSNLQSNSNPKHVLLGERAPLKMRNVSPVDPEDFKHEIYLVLTFIYLVIQSMLSKQEFA
jgi:uncharacterized protein YfkK (UPF0435 family)